MGVVFTKLQLLSVLSWKRRKVVVFSADHHWTTALANYQPVLQRVTCVFSISFRFYRIQTLTPGSKPSAQLYWKTKIKKRYWKATESARKRPPGCPPAASRRLPVAAAVQLPSRDIRRVQLTGGDSLSLRSMWKSRQLAAAVPPFRN